MSEITYNRNFSENTEEEKPIISKPDKTLVITLIFLLTIGILSVFSSSAHKAIAYGDNPLSFTIKQFIWLVGGIVGCWLFTYKIDYKKLKPYGLICAWIVVILLALVHFTSLGQTVNDAKRWLMIGPLQFQPSELAKPALVLCFATMFQKDSYLFDKKKLPYFIVFIVMLFFIYKQPNLSMVILLFSTFLAMYYCAGGGLKKLFIAGACLVPIVFLTIKDYQKQRILVWLDPEKDPSGAGYNIIQSLVAFASGNFFGVGYGNSKQKLSWLPEGHTDFIFAVMAEEFGFLGCFFIICLFVTLIYRGFIVASKTNDMFAKLLAVGITFSIGFQAFINMGVTSSLIPATGVPLPFISYGGSSLFATLCMFGILLNISKKRVDRLPVRNRYYETR